MIQKHSIAYHKKKRGQLFCYGSAKQIITMLCDEIDRVQAEMILCCNVIEIRKTEGGFEVILEKDGQRTVLGSTHLVIATGGNSIPKMGATYFAYKIAKNFRTPLTETHAALVPLTFSDANFKPLAGTALPVRISSAEVKFDEGMLFTHRGLSGPSILQISSYWREGEMIIINLIANLPLFDLLRTQRQQNGRLDLKTALSNYLPTRLEEFLSRPIVIPDYLADHSDECLKQVCKALYARSLIANGSEG